MKATGIGTFKSHHTSLDDKTPDEVYYGLLHPFAQAA